MRCALLVVFLLLASIVAHADSPQPRSDASRRLLFDWDDVQGATHYRLMYSVGSGAYRTALDNVPAGDSRATLSVSPHLASRPSLRYTVAACDTSGCARSNAVRPHFKPFPNAQLICGAGAAFHVDGGSAESVDQVCMQQIAARFFARRRFR